MFVGGGGSVIKVPPFPSLCAEKDPLTPFSVRVSVTCETLSVTVSKCVFDE